VLALLVLLSIMAACSASPQPPAPPDTCLPWGCDQQRRLDAALALVNQQQTGTVSIVVTDRQTGAVWQAGDPNLRTWAGSTPKLALTVSLVERARAGELVLTDHDWENIDAMLSVSDNVAADELWDGYADPDEIMRVWQTTYGMTGASYVDDWPARWGFVKLTAQDLIALVSYVLDRLDPTDRASIVDRMRTVGGPQQWGVWGAGPALRPGVKNGWDYSVESGSDVYRWVLATVGFVGPDERYLVAAFIDQAPGDFGTIEGGVHTLTDIVATVFGAPVPAPVVVPDDY
jgi:hypothetical protein